MKFLVRPYDSLNIKVFWLFYENFREVNYAM